MPKANADQPGKAAAGESWGESLRVGVPLVVVALLAFAIAWHFTKPAPPNTVVIATGSHTGVYYAVATKYANYFAQNGINLVVRETGGTAENYKLITAPGGDVDIAIVQGGASPPAADRPHIQAVAGIYYEPVMVFTRGDGRPTQLSQLAGKKIAIGADGSGVRIMASLLLDEAGVKDAEAGTGFVGIGGDKAADALTSGDVDAAFYVISPDAPVVTRLLGTPGVHLMSFDHAHAYGRLHPFLSATTLYQGVVDIKRNLPDADTQLVAAPATLVIRDSTHPAVIELLVRAAEEFNSGTTLLSDAGTFPSADRSELPINKDAKYFLKNPPSILRRTLPFWMASIVDRLIILVVPLLVVVIPLIRMMPPLMKWRTTSKLLRRYKRVRQIEEQLTPDASATEIEAGRDELLAMEKSLGTLKIPVSFIEELYNLRMHVGHARSRLEARLNQGNPRMAEAN